MGKSEETHAAVRAVFEADGEGDATSELSVKLRLGRPRADGTPGDQVGDELGRDCVEKFRTNRNAEVCEVAEQLAGETEAFVDFEGAVDIRIVDETLPADRRPGFLDQVASARGRSHRCKHEMVTSLRSCQ